MGTSPGSVINVMRNSAESASQMGPDEPLTVTVVKFIAFSFPRVVWTTCTVASYAIVPVTSSRNLNLNVPPVAWQSNVWISSTFDVGHRGSAPLTHVFSLQS